MTNFTPEQLIAFHYKDLPEAEMRLMAEALEGSWPLQEKYAVIREAAQRLDKAMAAAPQKAIDNVLHYGQAMLDLAAVEN
ncbi:MAG: hypothetical protein MUF29_06515 [Chitinophagaceae bacterium]|jgi:hypothetical protein|nr:hypothetical protein [Chitinophagaceae bacterium]